MQLMLIGRIFCVARFSDSGVHCGHSNRNLSQQGEERPSSRTFWNSWMAVGSWTADMH